jgi:hypothetical protein
LDEEKVSEAMMVAESGAVQKTRPRAAEKRPAFRQAVVVVIFIGLYLFIIS